VTISPTMALFEVLNRFCLSGLLQKMCEISVYFAVYSLHFIFLHSDMVIAVRKLQVSIWVGFLTNCGVTL